MSNAYKPRIMYIECKGGEFVETVFEGGGISKLSRAAALTGPARIGRVTFSRTGATMYYQGKSFERLKAKGFKSNYYDIETGEHYWISGPKRRGGDALYATNINAEIDEDVREEYWTQIRNQPELKNQKHT